MHLTPLTADRLGEALALVHAVGVAPRLDADGLVYRTFADPGAVPELLLLAEEEGRAVGFGFGCLRDGRGVIKLFGVLPAWRRRGIASAMFAAIEERLCAWGVDELRVEGVPPNYFLPGVPLSQTAAVAFLLARGYETDRNARVDLRVDLAAADLSTEAAERRLAADGVRIARAEGGEIEAATRFARAHFDAAWAHEVRDAERFSPTPLHLGWFEDQVVGFAAHDVTGRARFGPTGTRPDMRRRGLGTVLLKRCLRDLRDRGEAAAEIGWAGPIAYYARSVGATISQVYWVFGKRLGRAG